MTTGQLAAPLQFSVEVGDAGWYLEVVAWLVAGSAVLALTAAWMYLRYTGVGAEERRQLSALIPQLFRASSITITLERAQGAVARRGDLRRVLTRDYRSASEAGEATVRDSLRDLRRDLATATPDVPGLAVRGVVEGVLILAFGSTLFLSASWWTRTLDWPGASTAALHTLSTGLDLLFALLAAFPIPDELLVIALTITLTIWDLMVHYWWLVGTGLIALAVTFAVIDRETDEDLDVVLYPNRRRFLAALVGLPVVIWAHAVVMAALYGYLLGTEWSTIAGFGAALVTTSITLGFIIGDVRERLVTQQADSTHHTRLVAVYLLLRRVLMTAILLASPLLLYTGGASLLTGHAATVLGILLSAPLPTQLALLAGLAGVIGVLLYEAGLPSGIRAALRRFGRSTALRGWLFARGIPVIAMLLAFAVTWAFVGTQPIGHLTLISAILGLWPPLVAAIVVGVIVRLWTMLWTRVRYRFMDFWYSRDDIDPYVSVACYSELRDADDLPLYHARVFDVDLGHRDLDCLIRDIETVAEAYFEGDRPPATMSEYYWDGVRRGNVDLDETKRELWGDVYTRLKASFRENGGELSDAAIEGELTQEYPREAIDQALQAMYRDSDVSYRDGKYIHHGYGSRGILSRVLPLG